jgi:ABC-type Mn2+/Zn2+ transport system permease subunit
VNLQRAIVWLLVVALGLPIAMCVLYALARLLETMKDEGGANALGYMNVALLALWVIDLVALVIVQAVNSLGGPPPDDPGLTNE